MAVVIKIIYPITLFTNQDVMIDNPERTRELFVSHLDDYVNANYSEINYYEVTDLKVDVQPSGAIGIVVSYVAYVDVCCGFDKDETT